MKRTITCGLHAVLLAAGLSACHRLGPSDSSGNPTQQNLAQTASPSAKPVATFPAPAAFDRVFAGQIDGKYDIEMTLRRAGDNLTGVYFYQKIKDDKGAAQYISLAGTIDRQGKVGLQEADAGGGAAAEFKGRLLAEQRGAQRVLKFSGNWTKLKDRKTLPFALTKLLRSQF